MAVPVPRAATIGSLHSHPGCNSLRLSRVFRKMRDISSRISLDWQGLVSRLGSKPKSMKVPKLAANEVIKFAYNYIFRIININSL